LEYLNKTLLPILINCHNTFAVVLKNNVIFVINMIYLKQNQVNNITCVDYLQKRTRGGQTHPMDKCKFPSPPHHSSVQNSWARLWLFVVGSDKLPVCFYCRIVLSCSNVQCSLFDDQICNKTYDVMVYEFTTTQFA